MISRFICKIKKEYTIIFCILYVCMRESKRGKREKKRKRKERKGGGKIVFGGNEHQEV